MSSEQTTFKVFISHAHQQKELAGDIKRELSDLGLAAFVAHEDISPTEEWQATIIEVLRECDTFIAILTQDFKDSNWTDQETGMAVALGKTIIPVKVDVDPYGFIAKFQALKWRLEAYRDSMDELIGLLVARGIIAKEKLIEALAHASSFYDAKLKSGLLLKGEPFTEEQMNIIVQAAIQNRQIYQSWDAVGTVRFLIEKHQGQIDKKSIDKLDRLISGKDQF
ncbi:MAG TPA: toll/interleukin-1 receptor domain-containing protein [Nitrososphaerales archaeon]|nr:toll/interleukin-1 receptor domain-containing protein [Nitrososphaerales archaeon]